LIKIDSNERIFDIQTNSLKFLEENPGEYFKEVKKEVATVVGVAVVSTAVNAAVIGLTANPVLGVAAGIIAAEVVRDQIFKNLND
jgi:hypothetical protein